jgi:hypothetical protein
MATLKTQKVHGDLGSQEVAQLIASHNALLDAMGDLVTALKAAAAIGDVVTAATNAELAMETYTKKIQSVPNIPLSPAIPPE